MNTTKVLNSNLCMALDGSQFCTITGDDTLSSITYTSIHACEHIIPMA